MQNWLSCSPSSLNTKSRHQWFLGRFFFHLHDHCDVNQQGRHQCKEPKNPIGCHLKLYLFFVFIKLQLRCTQREFDHQNHMTWKSNRVSVSSVYLHSWWRIMLVKAANFRSILSRVSFDSQLRAVLYSNMFPLEKPLPLDCFSFSRDNFSYLFIFLQSCNRRSSNGALWTHEVIERLTMSGYWTKIFDKVLKMTMQTSYRPRSYCNKINEVHNFMAKILTIFLFKKLPCFWQKVNLLRAFAHTSLNIILVSAKTLEFTFRLHQLFDTEDMVRQR